MKKKVLISLFAVFAFAATAFAAGITPDAYQTKHSEAISWSGASTDLTPVKFKDVYEALQEYGNITGDKPDGFPKQYELEGKWVAAQKQYADVINTTAAGIPATKLDYEVILSVTSTTYRGIETELVAWKNALKATPVTNDDLETYLLRANVAADYERAQAFLAAYKAAKADPNTKPTVNDADEAYKTLTEDAITESITLKNGEVVPPIKDNTTVSEAYAVVKELLKPFEIADFINSVKTQTWDGMSIGSDNSLLADQADYNKLKAIVDKYNELKGNNYAVDAAIAADNTAKVQWPLLKAQYEAMGAAINHLKSTDSQVKRAKTIGGVMTNVKTTDYKLFYEEHKMVETWNIATPKTDAEKASKAKYDWIQTVYTKTTRENIIEKAKELVIDNLANKKADDLYTQYTTDNATILASVAAAAAATPSTFDAFTSDDVTALKAALHTGYRGYKYVAGADVAAEKKDGAGNTTDIASFDWNTYANTKYNTTGYEGLGETGIGQLTYIGGLVQGKITDAVHSNLADAYKAARQDELTKDQAGKYTTLYADVISTDEITKAKYAKLCDAVQDYKELGRVVRSDAGQAAGLMNLKSYGWISADDEFGNNGINAYFTEAEAIIANAKAIIDTYITTNANEWKAATKGTLAEKKEAAKWLNDWEVKLTAATPVLSDKTAAYSAYATLSDEAKSYLTTAEQLMSGVDNVAPANVKPTYHYYNSITNSFLEMAVTTEIKTLSEVTDMLANMGSNAYAVLEGAEKTDFYGKLPANVIVKGADTKLKADKLTLDYTKPYDIIAIDGTVDVDVTSTQGITDKNTCFYVPFDITGDNFDEMAKVVDVYAVGGAYQNVNGNKTSLAVGLIQKGGTDKKLFAKKPYIVTAKEGYTGTLSFKGVTISTADAAAVTVDVAGGNVVISFESSNMPQTWKKDAYTLNKESGKFQKNSSAGDVKGMPAGLLNVTIGGTPGANYVLSFDGDEDATAIEAIEAGNKAAKSIYTAGGVKVNDMTAPGLYIVDGKKVLVK